MHTTYRTVLWGLVNIVSGFILFYALPMALMVALNRTHGSGNNPDGLVLVPVGWFLLCALLLLAIGQWFLNFRFARRSKKRLLFFGAAFGTGAAAAVCLAARSYRMLLAA